MFMYIVVIARVDARFLESEKFRKNTRLYKLFAIENIKALSLYFLYRIYV